MPKINKPLSGTVLCANRIGDVWRVAVVVKRGRDVERVTIVDVDVNSAVSDFTDSDFTDLAIDKVMFPAFYMPGATIVASTGVNLTGIGQPEAVGG